MPKCAVWSCKNSSNNVRIRDGVSFFHYPRDPILASQWWSILAPVVSDTFKPSTAVVCSDHFHNDHKYMCKKRHRLTRNAVPDLMLLGPVSTAPRRPADILFHNDDLDSSDGETNMIVDIPEIMRSPSESMVCRVCLLTEGRMKRVTEANYEDAYKQVTGINWNKEDKLPQHLCWECGHRLQVAARFKRKALHSHNLLMGLRSDQNLLTLHDVKLIDRGFHYLMSNLKEKHFPPNQYLSNTTINNNQIFSQQYATLTKHLKKGSDAKDAEESKFEIEDENLHTEVKTEFSQGFENSGSNSDTSNAMDAYKTSETNTDNLDLSDNYKNLNANAGESNLTTYNNLDATVNLGLTDTYKNLSPNANSNTQNLQSISDNYNFTNTYKNLNSTDETNVPIYKNFESKTDNLNLADTYANLRTDTEDLNFADDYKRLTSKINFNNSDFSTYKNLESNTDNINITDTYKNVNPNTDDSYIAAYKNLESNTDNVNPIDTYKNVIPNTDNSYLANYKKFESNTDNLNLAETYKNFNERADDTYVPTYKDLDTNVDLRIKENFEKCNEIVRHKITADTDTDITFTNTVRDLENDKYDSDESNCLVIDAEQEADIPIDEVTLETVIRSEYVAASDRGMSIDELIDIYNNDGDGDERLQELNNRFGDEATMQIDQGWGGQRQEEEDDCPRLARATQDPSAAEKQKPGAADKPTVLDTSNIRSRAYDKLNRTLFTLTPVSEQEQIADVFKRQETFRYKRARFKCYLCYRSFQLRRAYDTHMLRHDASNGAYECTVCRARQKSPRAIKSHMYGQHAVRISCNDCSFVTMNRSVARSHEKWHAGTIYQCPHCPSQFDQESTYKSHLRTRHVHAFACVLCGFTFISRKGLAVHRCKRHAEADQIPLLGPYCNTCELRFVSEEAYSRHLKLSSRHRSDNSPL